VNDGAVTCRDKINDLAHGGRVFVTGNDEGTWRYLGRVTGLIQERPQVTGLILIIEVSGDIDPVHLSPPFKVYDAACSIMENA
jgi:hypothetical protein